MPGVAPIAVVAAAGPGVEPLEIAVGVRSGPQEWTGQAAIDLSSMIAEPARAGTGCQIHYAVRGKQKSCDYQPSRRNFPTEQCHRA